MSETENHVAGRVRASALSTYALCPRRAAARMFRDEIEASGFGLRELIPGVGAAIGTAVHAAAAATLKEKAMSGSLAPLDIVTDCAVETYRALALPRVQYDDASPDGRAAERQVVRMARAYQESVPASLCPVLVEQKLEAATTVGIILTGHADLVTDAPGTVIDLKTSRHARGYHVPQVGAYSLLARSNGVAVEAIHIDRLRRVPLRDEQPPVVPETLDVALAENEAVGVLRHIARDLKTFRYGDPPNGVLPGDPCAFLANPNSPLCGKKYNAAWGTSWCPLCQIFCPEED